VDAILERRADERFARQVPAGPKHAVLVPVPTCERRRHRRRGARGPLHEPQRVERRESHLTLWRGLARYLWSL